MAKKKVGKAMTADYPSYANERAANDPILAQIARDGRAFWQRRGVYVPDDLRVDVADNLADRDYSSGVIARGMDNRYGQPRLVLDSYKAGRLLALARSRKLSVQQRRDAVWRLGQIMYHEEGHAAGIQDHTPSGLMAADPSRPATPWEVRQYARKIIPNARPSKRVKRPARRSGEDW